MNLNRKYPFFSVVIYTLSIFFHVSHVKGQGYVFYGGSSDGHSMAGFDTLYYGVSSGGSGDGISSFDFFNNSTQNYQGAGGDGASTNEFIQNIAGFYSGGVSDGFGSSQIITIVDKGFAGGGSDGSVSSQFLSNAVFSFSGGSSDGHSLAKFGHTIMWNGSIGTGWNVSDNWDGGVIPSFCNPVIIPSEVPNFPQVNAGTFKIGHFKADAYYQCEKIKINFGAQLTTRLNCFVLNYGTIIIHGNYFVKNPSPTAFQNLSDGAIFVMSTGNMIVKE